MNKKSEGVIIWIVLAGALFFALRLPFLVYGGAPEIHDDVLQPRYTATPLSAERAMTQQAFAMMFFTPTYTVEPTQPFLAFLLPNTGATQTFTATATITFTATLSATPTRTLLPVFMTQTRVSGGGGGPPPLGPSQTPTKTPVVTLTKGITSTANPTTSATVAPTLTLEPTVVPIDTDTPAPTETNTPKPANTNKPPTKTPEPPPTDTPEPPPTDTPEPPPTDTPEPPPADTPEPPPGGNSAPDGSSTSSWSLVQFLFMYLLGGTFLGVVFRRQ